MRPWWCAWLGCWWCGYLAAFASSLIQDDPNVSINDLEVKISRLEKKIDILLTNQSRDNFSIENVNTVIDSVGDVQKNIKDPNGNGL